MPGDFVFVSHVNEDREAATSMVAALEAGGVVCWIAPRDVQPGRPYDDEIEAAIEGCAAMLLVFSERCNDSEYIRREVTVAGEARKRIIPVRIEDAQPKRGLRMRLVDLHWVDAFPAREEAIAELLRTLKGKTVREAAAPVEETPTAAGSMPPAEQRSPPPAQPHHVTLPPQHEDQLAKREIDGLIGVIKARIIALSLACLPVAWLILFFLVRLGLLRSLVTAFVETIIAAALATLLLSLIGRLPYLALPDDVRRHAGSEYFREQIDDLTRSGFLRACATVSLSDNGLRYRFQPPWIVAVAIIPFFLVALGLV
jgi:hypothetical protein